MGAFAAAIVSPPVLLCHNNPQLLRHPKIINLLILPANRTDALDASQQAVKMGGRTGPNVQVLQPTTPPPPNNTPLNNPP